MLEFLLGVLVIATVTILLFVIRQIKQREHQLAQRYERNQHWMELYFDSLACNENFSDLNELSARSPMPPLEASESQRLILLNQLNIALRYWIGRERLVSEERVSVESWLDDAFLSWVEKEGLTQDLHHLLHYPSAYPDSFVEWLQQRPGYVKP